MRTFLLLGDAPAVATKEAETVMTLETKLAEKQMTPVELRDPEPQYHKMTVPQLAALAPQFDWPLYLRSVCRRGFPLRTNARRRQGTQTAVETRHRNHRRPDGRGAGTAVCRAPLQPRSQTTDQQPGGQSDRRLRRAHPQPQVDGRNHPRQSPGQTEDDAPQAGIPGQVARLLRPHDRHRLVSAQWFPRRRVRVSPPHRPPRPSGGRHRVGNDGALRQRLLQRIDQRHHLSRRHPPATVF